MDEGKSESKSSSKSNENLSTFDALIEFFGFIGLILGLIPKIFESILNIFGKILNLFSDNKENNFKVSNPKKNRIDFLLIVFAFFILRYFVKGFFS